MPMTGKMLLRLRKVVSYGKIGADAHIETKHDE
jgi:hypothetical protein